MNPVSLVFLAFALGQTPTPNLLDIGPRSLKVWNGDGFYRTAGSARGLDTTWGVCSSDAGSPTRQGKLARSFTVPASAMHVTGRAAVVLAKDDTADHRLDVVLVDAKDQAVPKEVRTSAGWTATSGLLPRWKGQPRDYRWNVGGLRGQTLRLIIRDLDDRPGCYVYAGGFQILSEPDFEARDFARTIQDLEWRHQLTPMARYDTKRFVALSNAEDAFATKHLRYCEIFYDIFVNHFRRYGFDVRPAGAKLQVVIFDGPRGYEAYLGRSMPSNIIGIYDVKTNRLVVYDLHQNRLLLSAKEKGLRAAEAMPKGMAKTVERRFHDVAQMFNVGTTMHECAHLISFNSGLLNREADRPLWLVEGLACYCEATDEGDWQTIGSLNPMRINDLARARGELIPLRELIGRDDWLNSQGALGYSQSWALFRMLMQERPVTLRTYLATLAQRRTPDYRLADFRAAFGADLPAFERRYRAYLDDLIAHNRPFTFR